MRCIIDISALYQFPWSFSMVVVKKKTVYLKFKFAMPWKTAISLLIFGSPWITALLNATTEEKKTAYDFASQEKMVLLRQRN